MSTVNIVKDPVSKSSLRNLQTDRQGESNNETPVAATVWNDSSTSMETIVQQAVWEHMLTSPTIAIVSPAGTDDANGGPEVTIEAPEVTIEAPEVPIELPEAIEAPGGDTQEEDAQRKEAIVNKKWIWAAGIFLVVVGVIVGVAVALGRDTKSTTGSSVSVPSTVAPQAPRVPITQAPTAATDSPTTSQLVSSPTPSPSAAQAFEQTGEPTNGDFETTPPPSTGPFPIDSSYVPVHAPLYGSVPLERFGDKVSMSSDGTIIAVGSPGHPHEGEDAGAVNVYQNRSGSWRQVGSTLFGGAAEEKFGSAVALSGDGSLLVVGAPESFQDEGVRNPGFVRTFRLSTASQWEPIGIDLVGDSAGDRYGVSLALSRDGSTLVVGATQGADGDGYAKVFTRSNDEVSGWKHLRTFTGDAGDGTGYSVSVSSDGSFVAVGSDRSGPDLRGHVDVYMRSPNGIYVTAGSRLSGSEESDYFGESVSLSANGEFLAVGARFGNPAVSNVGQVRVYRLTPSSAWEPVGDSINGQFVRGFMGASVALSADGRTVVTSESGVGAGVVRVYHFDEVDWRLVGNSLSGGETNNDEFGHSVAISDSGRKIVVGAPRNSGSTGMVAVYEL